MKSIVNYLRYAIPTWIACLLILLLSGNHVYSQTDVNPNSVKLTISGNGYSDQTFVVIVPGSTLGFDSQYDAYKLMGIYAAPQLYSIISCCNLSVNAIPELYNGMEVQLGIRMGANTNYTIEGTGLYTFGNDTTIVLEDTKTSTFINLMTDSTYIFSGFTTDDEERFKLHYYCPMKFDLTVYLEGPYSGSGMMNSFLDQSDILPNQQPYNIAPWNYSGAENIVISPFQNVVDWILVELRDAPDAASANAGSMIERHACLLLNTGEIVRTDNETLPQFSEVITQNAFIVIYHRNHLGIMSSGPLVRNGGTFAWDFTGQASQAYGIEAQVDLGTGYYGLYSGDGNADGTINSDDKLSIWNLLVGKSGYLSSDYNLNGQANNQDKNDFWQQNIGKNKQYP